MQKLLSFMIVFIISVSPIVNASASMPSCEDLMNKTQSLSHAINTDVKSDAADKNDASTMAGMGDCCEINKVTCDHSTACDCGNSQVNYSTVPSIQIFNSHNLGRFKPRYISSLFLSKSPDSLYRPPIDILI